MARNGFRRFDPGDVPNGSYVLSVVDGWVVGVAEISVAGYTDEQVRDVVGALLAEGDGIDVVVNDAGNTITITCTITQYTDELARDAIGAALVAGIGITITVSDAGNTITIDADPGVVRNGSGPPLTSGIALTAPTHRASVQTANIPATAQGQDTLLAFTLQNSHLPNDSQACVITGWTLIATDAALDSWNGGGLRLSVFKKTAAGAAGSTSSEAGNAFTPTGTSYAGAWCFAYTPASAVASGENHTPDAAGAAQPSVTTGAISATYDNSRIVQAIYAGRGSGGPALSQTIDGTTVNRQTYDDTHTGIQVDDETQAVAGAVRTATWTLINNIPLAVALNVVLSPPVAPAPGNDGDWYIDTDTDTLYGPMAGGVWPSTGIPLGGTGSALTVKDEGSDLDTAVTSIDFTGDGVTATAVGSAITVDIPGGAGGGGGAVAGTSTTDYFTATAGQTAFTLSQTPTGGLMVFRNGLMQRLTTDYTVSGTTVTLTSGALVGDAITVIYGTGAAAGSIKDARWYAGPTTHAQDDAFDNASLDAAFVRVDNSTSNAAAQLRAVWTENRDSLSLVLNGTVTQDAAGEMHGLVKPYVLAVGEALETCFTEVGRDYNYHFAGLVVTDGTTFGSGNQVFYPRWSYINLQDGLWTGWNTRAAFTDYGDGGFVRADFTRIKRTATSTWSYEISANGFDWVVVATRTLTMTPSHIGFACGQWGGTLRQQFNFEFLRVR